jgi:hypothetical protein
MDINGTEFEEVSASELASIVAEGVHTGLRKGSEAPDSMDLWRAISNSDSDAWSDAARFLAWGLIDIMGYKVVKPVDNG